MKCLKGDAGCIDKYSTSLCPPPQYVYISCPGSEEKKRCLATDQDCIDNAPDLCSTETDPESEIDIKCKDGSIVTCVKGSPGCGDNSPTLCPQTPPEYIWISCPNGEFKKCLKGDAECVDNSKTLCPTDPIPDPEPEIDITCKDGSIVTCKRGSAGCGDNSPTLCPSIYIECKDGSTVKCLKGSKFCVDHSTTLCPAPEEPHKFIWISCPNGEEVKCLKGHPNCEDNNPILCPDPKPVEPCEEKTTTVEETREDGTKVTTTTVLGADPDGDGKRCLKMVTIDTVPVEEECPVQPPNGSGS